MISVPSDEILKNERLLEWRLERFAELGSSAAESSELAESEADGHLAAALASVGCPLELLRQIVLEDSTGRVHGCEAASGAETVALGAGRTRPARRPPVGRGVPLNDQGVNMITTLAGDDHDPPR